MIHCYCYPWPCLSFHTPISLLCIVFLTLMVSFCPHLNLHALYLSFFLPSLSSPHFFYIVVTEMLGIICIDSKCHLITYCIFISFPLFILQIVGCRFVRDPPDSTVRFTRWANTLTPEQLQLQVFMSHGPTVIMPTWFCHRSVFDQWVLWSLFSGVFLCTIMRKPHWVMCFHILGMESFHWTISKSILENFL